MEKRKPAELRPLVRRKMGLIVGPHASTQPFFFTDLTKSVTSTFKKAGSSLLNTFEQATQPPADERTVRAHIETFVERTTPATAVAALAGAKWNAVLSLALDSHLEDALVLEIDKNPVGARLTVINDLASPTPPHTWPFFKLLGSTRRNDVVLSTIDYKQRLSKWRRAVRAFADANKAQPVLVYGVADCDPFFQDLLVELCADHTTQPSSLIFLESEQLKLDAVKPILGAAKIVEVAGTIGEVVRSVVQPDARVEAPTQLIDVATKYSDLFAIVSLPTPRTDDAREKRRLLDLMFSPGVTNWEPFAHGLDFERTATAEVVGEVNAALSRPNARDGAVAVVGPAASGKTVVLKRVAAELAKSGEVVLWLKPWFFPDGRRQLADAIKRLIPLLGRDRKRLVFVMDSLSSLGSLTMGDVIGALPPTGLTNVVLLASSRSADWLARGRESLETLLGPPAEIEVGARLDDEETERLPRYLQRLGIYQDEVKAKEALEKLGQRDAQDLLSTLYFLLPETRSAISDTIRSELFDFGDSRGFEDAIRRLTDQSPEHLKHAYRLVAASDRLEVPVPIEVLVRALGVSYGDWFGELGPLASKIGLLYPTDSNEKTDSLAYRLRNSATAQIVANAVNGGRLKHEGEISLLEKLLLGCDGTNTVYREYCRALLLRLSHYDWIEYEAGRRLFEIALSVLPFKDQTLVHHQGIWERKKGPKVLRAIEILNEALATPEYQYSTRGEAAEHIYTSLAKATVDAMDRLELAFDEGRIQVMRYLSRARSNTFFNPNAVDVQARLSRRILERMDPHSVDAMAIANNALSDVQRALVLLKHSARRASNKDVSYLTEAQHRLISSIGTIEDLKRAAEAAWTNHSSQDGFILVARLIFKSALEFEKGSDFNTAFQYCLDAVKRIQNTGRSVSPDLFETGLTIYYQWRVQNSVGAIDWELVRDWSTKALSSARSKSDPLFQYMHALALAHLGDWSAAHAEFTQIRQQRLPAGVLWARRDRLKDANGNVRTIQGVLKESTNKRFLFVPELKEDFLLDDAFVWRGSGQLTHAQLWFAFGGVTGEPI